MISLQGRINVAVLKNLGDNISTVLKVYWQLDKTALRIHDIHIQKIDFGMGIGYNFSHYIYWHKIHKVYYYYYMAYQFRYVNMTFYDLDKIFAARGYDLQDTKKLGELE